MTVAGTAQAPCVSEENSEGEELTGGVAGYGAVGAGRRSGMTATQGRSTALANQRGGLRRRGRGGAGLASTAGRGWRRRRRGRGGIGGGVKRGSSGASERESEGIERTGAIANLAIARVGKTRYS